MMRRLALLAALLAYGLCSSAHAQTTGNTHLVVITGVSGDTAIAAQWRSLAAAVQSAAPARLGVDPQRMIVLSEDSTRDTPRAVGRSSKVTIERVLGGLARTLTVRDRLVVVIIAHGSSLSGTARVNLPGPDMTAADFARVLAPASEPTIAFVHGGSASGEFATALAGPRRVVITATKSDREQNATLFPGPFVRALTTDAGDADKDGRISLLEAFTYAQHEVEQYFTKGNLLPTEHAVLSDGAEGGRAKVFYLSSASTGSGNVSAAALTALAEVQARIDLLRARRSGMTEDAYLEALEPLMVELAERTRALRAAAPVRQP